MSATLNTKLHAANDGPQIAATMRMSKASARVVPLITLRQPKEKSSRGIIVLCALAAVLVGGAVAFWYADNLRESFKAPTFEPVAALPDPEQAPAYAETVTPPLTDVVAPAPEAPALPDALASTAEAAAANDPTTGIALQASSVQVPYPAAPEATKPDPAVAIIVDKIKDTAALIVTPPQEDAPQIAVQNAETPAIDDLLGKAQAKLDADDNKRAAIIYNRILAHDHANRAALAGKAKALENDGQYEAAAAAFRRLLALNPKDETVRVDLVSALGAWGAPEASNELQHMVATRPTFAPAQAALAQALVGQNDALGALPHAWRALQIDPNNILYRLDLAIAYDRLGHSSEAVGFYREVLKAYNNATDDQTPVLPVSVPEIQQRVSYLEAMMESAGKLALSQ